MQRSSPWPPRKVSAPGPPRRTSSPARPQTMSAPAPAFTRLARSSARITSSPGDPRIVRLAPATRVTSSPPQRGAAGSSIGGSVPGGGGSVAGGGGDLVQSTGVAPVKRETTSSPSDATYTRPHESSPKLDGLDTVRPSNRSPLAGGPGTSERTRPAQTSA